MKPQTEAALRRMQSGWVTPLEALQEFGCFRLGARVLELKKLGYRVETRLQRVAGKRFAAYRIQEAAQ